MIKLNCEIRFVRSLNKYLTIIELHLSIHCNRLSDVKLAELTQKLKRYGAYQDHRFLGVVKPFDKLRVRES